MHFLLNDVVFNLSSGGFSLPPAEGSVAKLKMSEVTFLGAELFAANPSLPHDDPSRALRLIGLILSKVNSINAALFVAPVKGCPAKLVTVRYAELSFQIISDLANRQTHNDLTAAYVNSQVWARLAG